MMIPLTKSDVIEVVKSAKTIKCEYVKGADDVLIELSELFTEKTGTFYEISVDGELWARMYDGVKAVTVVEMLRDHAHEYLFF